MGSLVGVCFIFSCYMLPTLVAIMRRHRARNSISIVNLFLGWTLLAWVICLAWAVGANVEKPAGVALPPTG